MFDKSEILAMLQDGTSVEEIGNAFADALNAANTVYKAAIAAEANKTNRKNKLVSITRDFMAWLDEFYPDLAPEEELTDADVETLADTLIESIDNIVKYGDMLKDMAAMLPMGAPRSVPAKTSSKKEKEAANESLDWDALIDAFING